MGRSIPPRMPRSQLRRCIGRSSALHEPSRRPSPPNRPPINRLAGRQATTADAQRAVERREKHESGCTHAKLAHVRPRTRPRGASDLLGAALDVTQRRRGPLVEGPHSAKPRPKARASLGDIAGSPIPSRYRRTLFASVSIATSFMRPVQLGLARTSIAKSQRSSRGARPRDDGSRCVACRHSRRRRRPRSQRRACRARAALAGEALLHSCIAHKLDGKVDLLATSTFKLEKNDYPLKRAASTATSCSARSALTAITRRWWRAARLAASRSRRTRTPRTAR